MKPLNRVQKLLILIAIVLCSAGSATAQSPGASAWSDFEIASSSLLSDPSLQSVDSTEVFGGLTRRCLLEPDVTGPCCGDGRCSPGENCPLDCAVCGNNRCEIGESCSTCPGDCGVCPYCGDGECNGTETCRSCSDCQNSCFISTFQTFYRGENSESIFYSYSSDGSNWYGDYTLGNGAQSRRGVAATIFNDRMFVFYRGRSSNDLYVSYSDDGRSWFGNQKLGNGAATDESPGVAVFNNKIYLVYKSQSNAGIWLSTSSDGLNWDPQRHLYSGHFGTLDAPSAFVFEDRLYLFWAHASENLIAIYVSDDGIGWEPIGHTGEHTAFGVSLAEFQGKVYMAFVGLNTKDVYVQSWNPSGGWRPGRKVLTARAEERPTLATDGDRLVLQWKGVNTNKNFYATSEDGINWVGNAESKGATKHAGPFMIHTD